MRLKYTPKRKAVPNFEPEDLLFDPRDGLPIRTVDRNDVDHQGRKFIPGCNS